MKSTTVSVTIRKNSETEAKLSADELKSRARFGAFICGFLEPQKLAIAKESQNQRRDLKYLTKLMKTHQRIKNRDMELRSFKNDVNRNDEEKGWFHKMGMI